METSTERLRLRTEQLQRNQPLAWDVYHSAGRLLLRRGFVIERDAQIESLIERGLYVDTLSFRANPVASSATARRDPLRDWENIQAQLGLVLQTRAADGSLVLEVREMATLLMQLSERHADMVLAAIMLMDQRKYPIAHAVHSAAISNMIARRAGWGQDTRQSLVCAALSMNVGMLALQLQLCNQREPLSTHQREAVDLHPAQSCEILQQCGVDDADWLCAVHEHHEKPEGKGYPRRIAAPCEAAMILQTADIFAAKVSPRTHRKPMIASEATKIAYVELSDNGRNPFPGILVKDVGIYPPGTIVKLSNGEVGVVQKRGPAANTPVVAVLSNAHGVPMLKPVIRATAQDPNLKIIAVMARDKALIGLNFNQIWCPAV